MGFFDRLFHWFTSSANWTGQSGIPLLFGRSLELSVVVVALALLLGGGLGLLLGHTGRGALIAVNAANAFRAVPTLALLTLLAIQPSIALRWDGFLASGIALTALAIPPILTNTYTGMREVDADVRDAAKAMGLRSSHVLWRVEAPLAVPFLMAGVRTAAIEVVATSTLAAYVGFSDLGTYVIAGLNSQNTVEAVSGALLVGVMAALVAGGLGLLGRALTPQPLRARRPVLALAGRPAGL